MSQKTEKNTMSYGSCIKALAVVAVVLIAVAGCDFFGVSIRDRIDQFMSDVNASRFSSLKEHLHSEATQDESADAEFWGIWFPEPGTYTVTELSTVGSTATGVMESPNDLQWNGATITFTMREETPGVWKILSIARGTDEPFFD